MCFSLPTAEYPLQSGVSADASPGFGLLLVSLLCEVKGELYEH